MNQSGGKTIGCTSNDLSHANRSLEVPASNRAVESVDLESRISVRCRPVDGHQAASLVSSIAIVCLVDIVEPSSVFNCNLIPLLRLVLLVAVRGHGSCDTHVDP